LIGGSLSDVRNSLNALDGSLVLQSRQAGSYVWRFKHPTVRDAFATVVAEDRELLDIYLAGTPIEKLVGEVSCGNVGIQGVKVIVPQDRFDTLIERLSEFDVSKWERRRPLHLFLAFRCDRDFLRSYLAQNPNFISSLSVGSYLTAVSDVDVLVRLQEFGLLPEAERSAAVVVIRELAVETPDSGFLKEGIRKLLKPEELVKIMEDVQTKLLPNLSKEISNWRWNWDSDEDPEGYFEPLVDALRDYRREFAHKPESLSKIDFALEEIEETVEELRSEQPQEPDSDDYRGGSYSGGGDDSRSVFDDVDQ
jgi:hypothetical protein